MSDFPLKAWLDRQTPPLRPYLFARRAGLAARTVYDLVKGLRTSARHVSLHTLSAIEKATGGEVSLRDMMDWFSTGVAPVEPDPGLNADSPVVDVLEQISAGRPSDW